MRPVCLFFLAAVALACQSQTARAPTESTGSAATLAGFTDSVVFSGRNKPVAVRFAPNGRIFVLEKGGIIYLYDSLTDTTPTVFLDFSGRVNSYWDRGLSGMAIHPNYPATPHIYLLYTHDTATNAENNTSIANRNGTDSCPTPPGGTDHGCVTAGVLSRIVDTGSYPLTTANETILITEWPQQYPGHSVQHLAFGPDGFLYASAGDGALHNVVDTGTKGIPVNPTNDPAGSGGALRVQSLRRPAGQNVVLSGAVIRIDPATGLAAPSNPNIGHADPEGQRIIAFGLRNPFRFTFHPTTGDIWIGDVGAKLYDEINRFSIAAPVENFGWPCYEGAGKQGGYDTADIAFCESLYSTTQHVAPFFNLGFGQTAFSGDTCSPTGGTAISGVAFYPTSGGNFPSNYQGAFFFSDYSRGCIWVMPPGANGTPNAAQISTFATGLTNIVDLQVGPGGDLYYVSHSGGTVRRIRHQSPNAVAAANPTAGAAPLTVQFDGAGSSKVSPTDTLSYAWDLDADGQYDDATGVTPSFVYSTQGTYNARLRVTDQLGRTGFSNIVTITVGSPPTAFIDTPEAGELWVVDQTINFSGHATDPDQGALPASALSWELFLEHCPNDCHSHSVQTWTGVASGSFPAPDHEYPSYLRLVLRATDATGITTTATRRIDPRTVTLTFDSAPVTTPRLSLGFNFESLPTPFSREVIIGSTVSVAAATQSAGGNSYAFQSWSDGGPANHNIVAPPTPTTYTATFVPSPWTSADVGAVAAAGSFTETGGTFTVRGSGADFYGTADEFHYVYKQLAGDGTITARVTSVQNAHSWTKAGVMMRENTAAGARNVAAIVSPTPANFYRLQARATVGGSSTSVAGGNGTVPVYLRINRTGNVFTASYSSDGSNFSALGTPQTIAMNETILVGLAVTSHVDGTVASAVFDNVSVTTPAPPPPPPAPMGVTATPGNGQVVVGWNPVSGSTSYSVKWSNTPGGPYTSINGITGASFTHAGLTNGVPYYYVVAASNAAGEGQPSGEVAATPSPPPPPAVPSGLGATAGNGQVALAWNPSAGAQSYVLGWATTPGGPYTEITGITGVNYLHTGLANGTPYHYVVAAVGVGGTSQSSSEVSATPNLPPAPPAPTGLGATAGNAQVALTWSAASGATSYTVKRKLATDASYTTVQAGVTTTSFTNTGLTNGTAYSFVVSASNAGGEGPDSSPVNATPTAPAFLTQDVGAVAAAGSWSQSGSVHTVKGSGADIAGTADEFRFAYQSLTGDGTITARVTSLQNVNSATKAGVMMRESTAAGARYTGAFVTPSTTNKYRFQARTSANGSTTTASSGAGTMPVYLRVNRTGNVFTASYSTNGTTFTQVGTAQTISMGGTILIGMAVTSKVDGTLATGVFDNVTITRPAPPPAPTGVTVTPGNAQVTVGWSAVSGATSYVVGWSTTAGGPYTEVSGLTGTSYVHTGRTNGTPYYYVVAAVNGGGPGPNSVEVSATPTLPPPPPAPTGLSATAGNAQVALTWSAAAGATSYTVKRKLATDTDYATVQAGLTTTNFTNTGLTNGTAYSFVVSASNAGGEGLNSTSVNATPTVPPQPSFLSADVGAVAAAGSWSEAGGVHTVKGSGADIWGTADEFRFVYRQVTGDATITARVTSLDRTHDFSKAGVMFRATLNANAVNVHSLISPIATSGYRFTKRVTAGATSTSEAVTGSPLPGAPGWVRLKRVGNVFTAYSSSNGVTFTQVGTAQTVSMSSTVYVGLAVTSHADGTLATAIFDNVTITTP